MNRPVFRKGARKRHPEYFEITDFVIKTLHKWIDKASIPAPTTALGLVLIASNFRSYNLFKSINNLLATDHWEDAAILARSMFELVLNLEEIQRQKGEEEERARKYIRFYWLQEHLHTKSVIEYDLKTGRAGKKEADRLDQMEKLAKSLFGEFSMPNKKSKWERSWCKKSVFQLAQDSDDPMRLAHYRIFYSLFSDLSHSGPFPALTGALIGENSEEFREWMNSRDDYEKEHLCLVLALSTIWLSEILMRGNSAIPDYDAKWNFEVLSKIFRCYGSTPPVPGCP